MGLLSTPPTEDSASDVSDQDSGSEQDASPQETVEREPTTVTAAVPKKPSRRDQAIGDLETRVRGLSESFEKERGSFREELSRRDEEIARLRGGFEALQPFLQRQNQPPPGKTPDELRREAKAALENRDLDTYERLRDQAIQQETLEKMRGMMPQQQAQQGPPVDPGIQMEIMMNLSRHPQLAADPGRALSLAAIRERELIEIYRHPPGPQTRAKAFELAAQAISAEAPQNPQYSANGRQVLGGAPTPRTNGSPKSEGPSMNLPANWKDWARRAGMSDDEYKRLYLEGKPDALNE